MCVFFTKTVYFYQVYLFFCAELKGNMFSKRLVFQFILFSFTLPQCSSLFGTEVSNNHFLPHIPQFSITASGAFSTNVFNGCHWFFSQSYLSNKLWRTGNPYSQSRQGPLQFSTLVHCEGGRKRFVSRFEVKGTKSSFCKKRCSFNTTNILMT